MRDCELMMNGPSTVDVSLLFVSAGAFTGCSGWLIFLGIAS